MKSQNLLLFIGYYKLQVTISISMRAEQELFIYKNLIFLAQNGDLSDTFDMKLMPDIEYINIKDYVNIFRKKNAIKQLLIFQIFDFTIQEFIPIDPTKNISKTYTYTPNILLRYTIRNQEQYGGSKEVKKQRNKQRSIRQVLYCVNKWRSMHTAKGRQKNKINLKDSARVLGISKKSLDDYFCQLRFAEKYGFDFKSNIFQRFGVLRSFVKKYKSRNSLLQPFDRLPKKLKILDDIQTILQTTKQQQKHCNQFLDQEKQSQLISQSIQDESKYNYLQQYSNQLQVQVQFK